MKVLDSKLVKSGEQVLGNVYFAAAHCQCWDLQLMWLQERDIELLMFDGGSSGNVHESWGRYHHRHRNYVGIDGQRFVERAANAESNPSLADGSRPVLSSVPRRDR